MTHLSFSERLLKRNRVWWGRSADGQAEARGSRLHRIKENHLLRRASDAERRWHCCDYWQRALSNKWNAREFAVRHGCRVPALYWFGRRPGAIPIERLPELFVIRRVWGTTGNTVYVFGAGRELLRDMAISKRELRSLVRGALGRISHMPVLVEEFLRMDSGDLVLPIEYKFHTFAGVIAAIEVVHRKKMGDATYCFYTRSWEPIEDQINEKLLPGAPCDPPRCLEEMSAAARTLGQAYGAYVRVDFYATDRGAVFGEFSSVPHGGRRYTEFADRYLGEIWQQVFPDHL